MNETVLINGMLALGTIVLLRRLWVRLQLSRAKHPSLRGHARWSRRLARLLPYYEFDAGRFYCSDGAPDEVAAQRREGMGRLRRELSAQSAESIAFSTSLAEDISDVDFTAHYRVPFPYRAQLAREFSSGTIAVRSEGVRIQDLDGTWRYDLAGSYGVNVFGYDFYKECLARGAAMVESLGPVLGPYHPVIRDNVQRLKAISGLDEVSFHMSGTEAVMQAVRLARYHTGRSHLVRLCGAYHGWWDGVQPGVGNERRANDIYTLNDMSERTLQVLATRGDIACVLVNPLQALHPNGDAPGDGGLVNSTRTAAFDRDAYTRWLHRLRDVCTRRDIVLIFDEVFLGFRLAPGGAQEYFGVKADMVTYGKTLGGGLPVGVVCGTHRLMKRYKPEHPADICFARGTFNSHPYVMAAMNVFLTRIEEPACRAIYRVADELWNARAARLNDRLAVAALPVRVANMHSVFTVLYTLPGRYNWMLQFYLRASGLELSWVGSGRFIFSLNYSEDDFEAVCQRFLAAASRMQADGWWWQSPGLTRESIRDQLIREMLTAKLPRLRGSGDSPREDIPVQPTGRV